MTNSIEDKKAELIISRQEQIVAAAKRIFAKNGYRLTTVDDIANDLSVGKGTLYRYFDDKKALFIAVFKEGIRKLQMQMTNFVYPIENPELKLRTAIKNYFEFFEQDHDLIEIMMQFRSEFKSEYRDFYLESYKDYIQKIRENLRDGIKQGVFCEMDIDKTADAVSAALQGVLHMFYLHQFGDEKLQAESGFDYKLNKKLTDMTDSVTNLILEGILKNAK